jgi:RNA polymerase sigma-70 factor (ECF subfamily)
VDKETLLKLVRENDLQAKHLLFKEFYRRVFATAFYITRDRNAAEDLTQEAFIKAFKSLHTMKKPEKFGAWIASIVSNLARDYLARENRFSPTADFQHLSMGEENADQASSTEELVLRREKQEAVRALLEKLPAEQRQVIILRYYYDLSMEEIAENLQVSTGTVKSRLHRAKKKIAALWEPKDDFNRHLDKGKIKGRLKKQLLEKEGMSDVYHEPQ